MAVQAALGSDIALAFDECTPFHVDRDYTARSTERTHRWLERCLPGTPSTARAAQLALRDRAGRRLRGSAPRLRAGGRRERLRRRSRSAARSGRTKAQMYEVVGCRHAELGGEHERSRATCSGSARWMI